GNDVDADELAFRALRDAGCAPNEPLAVRRACESDEDALACLPWCIDAVLLAVVGEGFVDAVGEPGESELAECRQVPGSEVVGEGSVDPFGGVDVPACEAILQCDRSEVDQLNLVCPPDDGVRNGLALFDSGDLLDDVVEGLQV